MNETINDFEEALDTWDMVTDANGRKWILDENECPRCACGDSWVIRGGHYQPEPPFANAHEQQETGMTERTYTRADMARAWDEGHEDGAAWARLNTVLDGGAPSITNPYREEA